MITGGQQKAIDDWKSKRTNVSWTFDAVLFYNQGIKLEHTGGEDGSYIQIDIDGKTVLGTYEGAIQWITDAIFKPEVTLDLTVNESVRLQHYLTK